MKPLLNILFVAALSVSSLTATAADLWVGKEELDAAPVPTYDKKTRMAFIEKCRRQFGAQESSVPAWCPCAFDFVAKHNYYVQYLSFKAKGSEMDRALRPYVRNITRECGWVDLNSGGSALSTPRAGGARVKPQ